MKEKTNVSYLDGAMKRKVIGAKALIKLKYGIMICAENWLTMIFRRFSA
mgnify:CR=1 FL=1